MRAMGVSATLESRFNRMARAQRQVTVERNAALALKQSDPSSWAEVLLSAVVKRLERLDESVEVKEVARDQLDRIREALLDKLAVNEEAA